MSHDETFAALKARIEDATPTKSPSYKGGLIYSIHTLTPEEHALLRRIVGSSDELIRALENAAVYLEAASSHFPDHPSVRLSGGETQVKPGFGTLLKRSASSARMAVDRYTQSEPVRLD